MRQSRHAYTLVEMLTTVAGLVILLGMMVGLARHVRATSAEDVTKDLLRRLDEAMGQYIRDRNGGAIPAIPLFIPQESTAEQDILTHSAEENSRRVVRLLQTNHALSADPFADLSIAYFDGSVVRDAWGNPIVFMPRMHPAIGMAAKGWFFFSAGPDRKYTTKTDNLYSYELPGLDEVSR
jgi:hypothetical protein